MSNLKSFPISIRPDRLKQALRSSHVLNPQKSEFSGLSFNRNRSSLQTTQAAKPAKRNTISAKAVPARRAFYNLTVSGTTYAGNTAFPSPNTSYNPIENFRLGGTLVVEPTIRQVQNSGRNGVNVRDIGFFVGTANDYATNRAGSLRYGTHTYMHRYWGGRTLGRPALDTAYVNVNGNQNLRASVDSAWARNDTTNTFAWRTSLLSAPKQILQGHIQVRFTNGGRNVVGQAVFVGGGIVEPGTYAYAAQFSGQLAR
jgi:hypothetical protein